MQQRRDGSKDGSGEESDEANFDVFSVGYATQQIYGCNYEQEISEYISYEEGKSTGMKR